MSVASERLSRLDLLTFPLDPVDLTGAVDLTSVWLFGEPRTPRTVVTLNPEIVVQAQHDATLAGAIRGADLVTADGVGIVWAAKQLLGEQLPGRAPGLDLTFALMERHGAPLRVFFLGGKPGVPELAAQKAVERWGITVAGAHHGYFGEAEDGRVADLVRDAQPHLLLTAMGARRQEVFNQYWRQVMNVPVMVGVGGTLDVLAGSARLAPSWTRRLGVEWVWRVAGDRQRWGRAPRLAQFVRLVRREKKRGAQAGGA